MSLDKPKYMLRVKYDLLLYKRRVYYRLPCINISKAFSGFVYVNTLQYFENGRRVYFSKKNKSNIHNPISYLKLLDQSQFVPITWNWVSFDVEIIGLNQRLAWKTTSNLCIGHLRMACQK